MVDLPAICSLLSLMARSVRIRPRELSYLRARYCIGRSRPAPQRTADRRDNLRPWAGAGTSVPAGRGNLRPWAGAGPPSL